MLSRQINFFHTSSDVSAIIEYTAAMEVDIYCYKINHLQDKKLNPISPPPDRIEIVPLNYQDEIYYRFVEKQNYYLFDTEKSYAIEISFCVENNNQLSPARLYCTSKYLEHNTYASKEDVFIEWTKKFYAGFKKRFLQKNSACLGWYVTAQMNKGLIEGSYQWGPSFNSVICST